MTCRCSPVAPTCPECGSSMHQCTTGDEGCFHCDSHACTGNVLFPPSMPLVEKIIESARLHGMESEPDMEVGDLQEALRLAWKFLPPSERAGVHQLLDLWEKD